jgi:4-carboxymuconolactone decarboxylase
MRGSKHLDMTRRDLLIAGAVSAMATGAPGLALAETSPAKTTWSLLMSEEPTNARKSFGDIAPHLAEITDKVLFGDVWANTTLSPRDRSLVTITSLISLYRINELPFHLKKAVENGITKDEIIETITHLAFYAGWPPAMTALQIVRKELDA